MSFIGEGEIEKMSEISEPRIRGYGRNPESMICGVSNSDVFMDGICSNMYNLVERMVENIRLLTICSHVAMAVNRCGTEPYARWCERTEGVNPPPTRLI